MWQKFCSIKITKESDNGGSVIITAQGLKKKGIRKIIKLRNKIIHLYHIPSLSQAWY